MCINRREFVAAAAGASVAGSVVLLHGCRGVPDSGRRQLMLMSEAQELALAGQAWRDITARFALSANAPLSQLVHRAGQRIAAVARRENYDWEFLLLEGPRENAVCLPGGKLAVFEGMLPLCDNEAGLAVLMAHGVAHAVSRHGGERMSRDLIGNSAKGIAGRLAKDEVPGQADILLQAYGGPARSGTTLPFSPEQEAEADRAGVMMLARAGYDPNEAPRFWQRMATRESAGTSLLQTHPADTRRTTSLMAMIGEASRLYDNAERQYGRGQTIVAG